MAKYKLCASVSWVAGSDTDFGIYEFDTEEDASEAAFDAACEYLDVYVILVEDEE